MNQPRVRFALSLLARQAVPLSALLIALQLATSPLPGQRTVGSALRDGASPVELETRDGNLQLGLEEAIEIALRRNLGLRVERYRRAQLFYGIEQGLGIYDLNFLASLSAADNTSPSQSTLEGTGGDAQTNENQNLRLNLEQLIPSGGSVAVDLTNTRFANNNLFSQINPGFRANLTLSYSQPLLRNRGKLATERNLRVARINSASSLSQFEAAVTDLVDDVESAYWSLVEAKQQLTVAEESLALAEELHQMNEIQVEVGTLAPLELIQSEVGIATRQEEIIRARATVDDAADELRRLLNIDNPEYWSMQVEPTTDPEIGRITVDLEGAMQSALEERPEVVQQRLRLETLELDLAVSRNQLRPGLDLVASYGFEGLDGDRRVFPPGTDPFDPDPDFILIPGGNREALQQALLDQDFDSLSVRLTFSYPLQNRTARAAKTIAELAFEEGKSALGDLELSILTEVRSAVRGVETAAQQIDSARISMRLAERNLDAERKRYENGLSGSFQVLEIQTDLTEARSRLVAAITGYRRALVRYFRAIGRLLEENGIELVDDVEAGETP